MPTGKPLQYPLRGPVKPHVINPPGSATRSVRPVYTHWRLQAAVRRTALALVVFSQTTLAAYAMIRVLPYHGGELLELCLVAVFALLFFGISIGFWMALYGFLIRLLGGDRHSLLTRHSPEFLRTIPLPRTAVVMPVYHEPVDRTFAGLRAVYRSIAETGQLEHFDFYVLSDSRDPEYWLEEQAAWYSLCRELGAAGRLFYRRRSVNIKHKSGNIADFLRRWGLNYRYFLVLDADSLMEGRTIVTMVQLMEAEPGVGILQSCPVIVRATSLYARSQQFASRLFSPIFATGLAALQLGDAAYWGHNALVRTRAFIEHCGLRKLPGAGLFKGAIMSHDFVEAAYMGKAGFEVWLEPGLSASYEESPPTLVEDLIRDRRWARGNLQHLWLLFKAKRLRFAHRLVFLHGIMSYLSSPLWLLFLVLTALETARLILRPINYFPRQYSLFPVWPEWHPDLAVTLVSSALVMLFLPKFLAAADVLWTGRIRDFGGLLPLLAGLVVEIVISILLAPVRMIAHCRFVIEALLNVNLQWAGQNRDGETGWRATLRSQLPTTLLAACWLLFAASLSSDYLLWSLPVAVPLLLSAPVSMVLGRRRFGQGLRKLGILVIAEERQEPPLLQNLWQQGISKKNQDGLSLFEKTLIDKTMNRLQLAMARDLDRGARGEVLAKLRQCCLEQGPGTLTVRERALIAGDRTSLLWLHQAIWQARKNSCWWPILARRLAT
jgi:membrane glycosyltransferase